MNLWKINLCRLVCIHTLHVSLSLTALLSFFALPAFASSIEGLQKKLSEKATIAIVNATVYTMTSEQPINNGGVLILDGRIESIAKTGQKLTIPKGVEVFDAQGGTITPGLINTGTQIGVLEIGAIVETVDIKTLNPRVTASLKMADAFNPHSTLIPLNRIKGLTHTVVVPASGSHLIAGQAALANLSGKTDSIVDDYAALVVNLGAEGQLLAGGSKAAALMQLREALEDAKDYEEHKKQYDQRQRRSYALSRLDLAALAPVVKGKKPMLVYVDRAADIRAIMKLAAHYGLKLIIGGGAEAWMVASELAEAQIPVIIDPMINIPNSYDSLGARADSAAILHQRGVTVLFTGVAWQQSYNAYLVRQGAGNAVANGLPKAAAIAAITKNPAGVFGVGDRYGVIKKGLAANLVLWQGDPLELSSGVRLLFIEGDHVPLVSRSTRLADQYFKKLQAVQ